jgi:SAM-dependent methyltransferase
MTREDRWRWDRRYAERGLAPVGETGPPPVFAAVEHLFPTGGQALDLACGRGRGAVWLAARGLHVRGVDVSPVAIDLARELSARCGLADRCRFDVVDLDGGLPDGAPVDLVLCHMFREPRLYEAMVDRLAPGGLVAVAVHTGVGGESGSFRARPGELREAFAGVDVIAGEEGDGVAWIVARKLAAGHS